LIQKHWNKRQLQNVNKGMGLTLLNLGCRKKYILQPQVIFGFSPQFNRVSCEEDRAKGGKTDMGNVRSTLNSLKKNH